MTDEVGELVRAIRAAGFVLLSDGFGEVFLASAGDVNLPDHLRGWPERKTEIVAWLDAEAVAEDAARAVRLDPDVEWPDGPPAP